MIAIASGGWVLVVVVIVIFFAVVFSYYSRTGSDINQRPHDGRGQSPGSKGESHISTADDDVERTVGTRGTK